MHLGFSFCPQERNHAPFGPERKKKRGESLMLRKLFDTLKDVKCTGHAFRHLWGENPSALKSFYRSVHNPLSVPLAIYAFRFDISVIATVCTMLVCV